jgi:hypothetical protein
MRSNPRFARLAMSTEHTVAALASTAIALVTPYLAEAAKAGAKKMGEAAGDGVVLLWAKIRARLTASGQTNKIEKLEEAPNDERRQTILAGQLEELLESDPSWRAEVADLVARLPRPGTVVTQTIEQRGKDGIAVQVTGQDNAVTVTRGRSA